MRALFASIAAVALLVVGWAWASGPVEHAEPSRPDKVVKTEAEWRKALTDEQFYILRQKGTERPFTGPHLADKGEAVYACGGCGLELFHSDAKFDSGTGWPSYFQPVGADRVDQHLDAALGMLRTEVTCARCGGHLGHVFTDGPKPTGLRYCINGHALTRVALDDDAKRGPKPSKPASRRSASPAE